MFRVIATLVMLTGATAVAEEPPCPKRRAQATLTTLKTRFEAYEKLAQKPWKSPKAELGELTKQLTDLERGYATILGLKCAEESVASLVMVGRSHDVLCRKLQSVPAPKEVPPEAQEAYQSLSASPSCPRAHKAFTSALDTAKKHNIQTEYVTYATTRLAPAPKKGK
jgi:hypothetical protein